MRSRGPTFTATVARLLVAALVCSLVVAGVAPVAAQSGGGAAAAASASDGSRCFPSGGHDLSIGDGNPHINVTVHTSLFTSPAPPSALGLAASGVALDSEIVELRTGVLFEGRSEDAEGGLWDSFAVLFDYRLSLPMFSDAYDDSTYEPDGGPVSGVETRGC
jgi:hypothetical protein